MTAPVSGSQSGHFERITCEEREALVDQYGRSYNGFADWTGISVLSGCTDMSGEITGRPYVMTEWGYDDGTPVLRDERWPDSDRTCEHRRWVEPWSCDCPTRCADAVCPSNPAVRGHSRGR